MGDPPDLNNPSQGVTDPRQGTRQRLSGSHGRTKFAPYPLARMATSTPSPMIVFVHGIATPPPPASDGGVVVRCDHAMPTSPQAPLRVAEVDCILTTHDDHGVLPCLVCTYCCPFRGISQSPLCRLSDCHTHPHSGQFRTCPRVPQEGHSLGSLSTRFQPWAVRILH